ncbi:hypothetical protein Emag_005804 [Eimeria magna]
MTAARSVLTGVSQGPGSLTGLANRMRLKQLRTRAVTDDQVERVVGFALLSGERLAGVTRAARTSLPEFFNGVYLSGRAMLGSARLCPYGLLSCHQHRATRPRLHEQPSRAASSRRPEISAR